MFESAIALSGMTKTTLAINELKKNDLHFCFTDPTRGGHYSKFGYAQEIFNLLNQVL